MSRLANMPIKIPSTVKVTLDKVDGLNKLSLSNGTINESWTVHSAVNVEIEEGQLSFAMSDKDRQNRSSRAMLGTDYRHIENLVKGLDKPFETILEIHGLGYRVKQSGMKITLTLGKSHDDIVDIPENVKVEVPGG